MDKQKYLEDLADIKMMMDRSSRFISLSGMSGVVAGVAALIGAYLAYQTVYVDQPYLSYRRADLSTENLWLLMGIAIGVLIVSFAGGLFFTQRKAKQANQKLWDNQSKRLLINLFIPLVTGGFVSMILLHNGFIGLTAPLTLVFYGLSLVNASKYTLTEIRSLGIIQIGLGLVGCQFIGYGLILWSLGFGVMHVVYGVLMYKKYES